MIDLLSPIAIAAGVVTLQAWPRAINRYFGVDTWRNLSIAAEIRARRRLPKQSIDNQLIKGPFDYPPLFFVLMALVPPKWLERWQGVWGPATEGLHSLLVYGVIFAVTGSARMALTAQATFLFVPVTALENATMNARGFGSILFTLSAVATAQAMHERTLWLFALATVATIVVFFSHKMAAQVIYLTYPVMSLLLRDVTFVAVAAGAIAVSLLLFRRRYIWIIRGQLAVLRWFRAVLDVRYAHQITGELRDHGTSRDVIVRVKHAIGTFPLVAVFASSPLAFVALAWAFAAGAAPRDPDVTFLMRLSVNALATLIVLGALTAWVRPLRFLGEGTKYLVYSQLPTGAILAVLSHEEIASGGVSWMTLVSLGVGLGCIAQIVYLQRHIVLSDQLRSLRPALEPVLDVLRRESGVHVAVFPFPSADIVAYFSGCRTLRTDSAFAYWDNEDYRDLDPVMRKPLPEVLAKYAIKYVLISTNYVQPNQLGLGETPEVVVHSGGWMLLLNPAWAHDAVRDPALTSAVG